MHIQSAKRRFRPNGASLILVLVCTMVGGFGLTCWMYLLAARLRQADTDKQATSRRLMGFYASGMTQQYSYNYKFRHQAARPDIVATYEGLKEGTTLLSGFSLRSFSFGIKTSDAEYKGIEVFTNTETMTDYEDSLGNKSEVAYNNITRGQLGGAYFVPTESMFTSLTYEAPASLSNPRQLDTTGISSSLFSYPRSLLGDLMTVYASDSGSSYNLPTCLNVSGRVVILDSTPNVSSVKATSVLNMTKTAQSTTLNSSGSASLMPPNFPSYPIFTDGGTEGDSPRTAQLDGTLNVINNSEFTPGSIWDIMRKDSAGSILGSRWIECTNAGWGTSGSTYTASSGETPAKLRTGYSSSATYTVSSTTAIQAQRLTSTPNNSTTPSSSTRPAFTPLTGYGSYRGTTVNSTNPLYTLNVRLKYLDRHVYITEGAEQVILEGAGTSTDYTSGWLSTTATSTPVIIYINSTTVKDVRLVGECPRPIILVTAAGTNALTQSWMASGNVTGVSTIDWRIHFINQSRTVYLYPPTVSTLNVVIYGGIRTNWTIAGGTGTSTSTRFTLNQETTSSHVTNLISLLPRDGWLETLFNQ